MDIKATLFVLIPNNETVMFMYVEYIQQFHLACKSYLFAYTHDIFIYTKALCYALVVFLKKWGVNQKGVNRKLYPRQ
jgi:hypothetical protein